MKKALKFLSLGLLAGATVIAVLMIFFDMRLEMTGAKWGGMPSFVFHDQEDQWQRLEAHRRSQSANAAMNSVVPSSPVSTVSEEPASGELAVDLEPVTQEEDPSDERSLAQADPGLEPSSANQAGEDTESLEAAVQAVSQSSKWPSLRGPDMNGIWTGSVSLDWSEELPVLYKQPIGVGFSSFVAGAGLAFTLEQRRDQEVVAAYDPMSGAERWTYSWPAQFTDPTGDGPRATPSFADGRLVALGAMGDLVVLEAATGAEIWRRNILSDAGATNVTWGMSGSPLIVDGLVIVHPGSPAVEGDSESSPNTNATSIAAYDSESGEIIWQVLTDRGSYTAPMVVTLQGIRQVLAVTATRAVGLSIQQGQLLWEYPWHTRFDVNAAQPIPLGDDRVFISAGYDHGAASFQVKKEGSGYKAEELWLRNTMKNQFSSSVLWEGHIYGFDNGIFACIDAETGERRWKGGRYGHGQLVLTEGGLIVITEKGDLAVVELTPEAFRERSRHKLLSGKTWNVPAIIDDVLLVRNAREMAAIDLRS